MKVQSVTPPLATALGRANEKSPAGGRGFREVMQQVREHDTTQPKDFHAELQGLYQRMEAGQKLQPQELLVYQIKAGEYHLKVELVSKAGEAVQGTLRRFQNGQ